MIEISAAIPNGQNVGGLSHAKKYSQRYELTHEKDQKMVVGRPLRFSNLAASLVTRGAASSTRSSGHALTPSFPFRSFVVGSQHVSCVCVDCVDCVKSRSINCVLDTFKNRWFYRINNKQFNEAAPCNGLVASQIIRNNQRLLLVGKPKPTRQNGWLAFFFFFLLLLYTAAVRMGFAGSFIIANTKAS